MKPFPFDELKALLVADHGWAVVVGCSPALLWEHPDAIPDDVPIVAVNQAWKWGRPTVSLAVDQDFVRNLVKTGELYQFWPWITRRAISVERLLKAGVKPVYEIECSGQVQIPKVPGRPRAGLTVHRETQPNGCFFKIKQTPCISAEMLMLLGAKNIVFVGCDGHSINGWRRFDDVGAERVENPRIARADFYPVLEMYRNLDAWRTKHGFDATLHSVFGLCEPIFKLDEHWDSLEDVPWPVKQPA